MKKHDITNLTATADLNAKINEIKSKRLRITSFATTTALIAAENKIPDVSTLIKKADYDTKVGEIVKKLGHKLDKCITPYIFNKLVSENFEAR